MKSKIAIISMLPLVVSALDFKTWLPTAGNDVQNLYSFASEENWKDSLTPAAGGDAVDIRPGAVQYIQLPNEVKLGYLKGNGNVRLIGEKVTLTSALINETARFSTGWVFADLYVRESTSDKAVWFENAYIAGRVKVMGDLIPAGGNTYLRFDCYATHSNPLRTDDVEFFTPRASSSIHPGNGHTYFVAGGAAASQSTWKTVAGSPFIVAAVGTTPAYVAPGTIVTGEGIPEGTFVRRRFNSNVQLELSNPVTVGGDAVALSFAEFHPDVRVHLPYFRRQGTDGSTFFVSKRLPEDNLVIEVDWLSSGGERQYYFYSTEDNFHPGTILLHSVTGGFPTGNFWVTDILSNCHFMFGGEVNTSTGVLTGNATVFPEHRVVGFSKAVSVARMTVPEGPGGVITCFTNCVGTLTKDGVGNLSIGMCDAVNTGKLVIEEGTLTLTNYNVTAALEFAEITIAAGAELVVPECGIVARKFTCADGAKISGKGTLTTYSTRSGNAIITAPARVLYALGNDNAYINPADLNKGVAGHPAFWLDASKPDTIVYTEEGGVNYVTRWNDCREGEPMFCTNMVARPTYIYNPDDKRQQYVKLTHVYSRYQKDTQALVWSDVLKDVRAIFLVQDPADGGGMICGNTQARLPTTQYSATQGGTFYRDDVSKYSMAIFSSAYGSPRVKDGRVFINGREIDPLKQGYEGAYLQVLDWHANTNSAVRGSNPYRLEVYADVIGMGYKDDDNNTPGYNGRMRIAEYIVYTNSLTHAERVQTAQYLSQKWLGCNIYFNDVDEKAVAEEAVALEENEGIIVADGATYGFNKCEGGADLQKDGDGLLVINSLEGGRVDVKGGELLVKSFSTANTCVPRMHLWMHVDADDATTVIKNASDETKLSKWVNLADTAHGYVNGSGTAHILPNELNGRTVISCGTMNGADKAALKYDMNYTHSNNDSYIVGAPYIRSAFIVYSAAGGGNSLLGGYGNGYPYQGLPHCPWGDNWRSLPIFSINDKDGLPMWTLDAAKAISNDTYKVRADGVRIDPFTRQFKQDGYEVFSFIGNPGRKSDTLATYGQGYNYVGGLNYAEVIIYTNVVNDATAAAVEAYLGKKWFNRQTSGYFDATCEALSVAEGATLKVCEFGMANGYGNYNLDAIAPITTGELSGGGSVVAKEVKLIEPGRVVNDFAHPTTLSISGILTLPQKVVVNLVGNPNNQGVGTFDLISAKEIVGTPVFEISAPEKPIRTYAVKIVGNKVKLTISRGGTSIILR